MLSARTITKLLFSIVFVACVFGAKAQCPTLYDYTGTPSANPYWIGCTGTDYTVFIQSPDNIGAWTVDWGDGSPMDAGPDLIPPAFISHLYPATIDTFVVTFTETGSGCVITGVVVMEEPVNASIQIPIGGVTYTCAPGTLDFLNSSTDVSGTTTFWWDFGDGSPIEVYDSSNVGQTISHTYQPGTVNCNTQVTLTAENYCSFGTPTVATFTPIQIWDIDDAQICPDNTILCFPDNVFHFDNCTNLNCFAQGNNSQRFEYWNFGDYWGLGYDSIVDWAPFNPPALPGYDIAYPGVGSYDLMLIDSSFCGIDTAMLTVQIIPPPTAGLTISDDTICPGEIVTLINGSGGGANQCTWNFGDGTGWQNLGCGNQNYTWTVPGDYTITIVAGIAGAPNTCTDTATVDVHVLTGPIAGMMLDNNIGCDSLTVNYTDVSANAIAWEWDFDNGNTFTGQFPPPQDYNAGNYTPWLAVTALNGCTDTAFANVDVFNSPTVSFLPTSACQNELAQFTDLSTSDPGDPIVSWFWDFDDGNTSTNQNPTNTFTATGTYDVSLTISTANCYATDTVLITIDPTPVAGFTEDVNVGCTPLLVQFTDGSAGAATWFWDFGDGATSTAQNPSHTFINSGTVDTIYTVMQVAYNAFGCSDTAYTTITVYPAVSASFTHNGFPGCAPMMVDFNSTSTGGTSYQWDFGDSTGSTLMNPSHLYTNTTLFIEIFTVELVVTSPNGCTDTTTQNIMVYPTPDFTFTALPDSGCSPLTVTFPTLVGAVDYQWDFGDGTNGTGPNPTHTYYNSTTNDSTYNVQLIATSAFGCVDTTYATVTVQPNPTAQFSLSANAGCHPFTVSLTNSSLGGTNFYWDYGDGGISDTTAAVHDYTYSNTSGGSVFYDISLIAETVDGCTDTAYAQVEVYPEVIAAFTSDTIGCSPLPIQFTDQSIGAVAWDWDFGDGFFDIVQNPNHTFTNLGTNDTVYTVMLVATNAFGCTDTAWQDVLVHPVPMATFTALPVNQQYPSATVTITNTSTTGSFNYIWDFDDGTGDLTMNPPPHVYATWGTYDITLIVSSPFCADTTTQTVVILPPDPVAGFIGSGEGCAPLTVAFTDTSEYAVSWLWNFGDGNTSTLQHPIHTYTIPGTYTISLIVTGPGGSTDQALHIDSAIVHENAIAYFVVNPATVYVPTQPTQLYNFSQFSDTYYWDFGDGTNSTDFEPAHQYYNEGSYDIMLIANNQWNCPDTFIVTNAVIGIAGGEIIYPNAFTPSPDGPNGGVYDPWAYNNDVFFPVYQGVDEYHMMIFNRWGELIFESFDPQIGWDGYYRGELCQQDVYVWKVNATFTNGDEFTKAGDLHLIR